MEKNNPLSEMMQESMAKVREMADTNTIVGQPIQTPDGVTLIPISKVSLGFGCGGGDYGKVQPKSFGGGSGAAFGSKKKEAEDPANLGAGIGAGVRMDPVAFLIVKDGITRVMPVAVPAMNTVDRVVEMVPEVMDRVTNFINDRQKKKEEAAGEAAEF